MGNCKYFKTLILKKADLIAHLFFDNLISMGTAAWHRQGLRQEVAVCQLSCLGAGWGILPVPVDYFDSKVKEIVMKKTFICPNCYKKRRKHVWGQLYVVA